METATLGRVFEVNLTGPWLSMKHEIRAMNTTGGGAVVNITPQSPDMIPMKAR
ncbi:hypothetical protein [Agrobacterium radiobacter]|uniref:hypothetical protein n=1 Tax=Agrobacterium radiobacter TaxID=362 RepID=UPI003467B9CA